MAVRDLLFFAFCETSPALRPASNLQASKERTTHWSFASASRSKEMKANLQFASLLAAAGVSLLLSLPVLARPANPPQNQDTQSQSSSSDTKPDTKHDKKHDKHEKAATSPGHDVGKGGEDIGKGTAKGAGSLGKGTAEGAGNLATLHPGKAGADLGKGAAGAGKDVGVGAGKGAGKLGEGGAKGLGKLGHKIFHRGNKNKVKNEEKSGS
jgi:hypothetical protein